MILIPLVISLAHLSLPAQQPHTVTIDMTGYIWPISPYIYGVNWVHAGESLYTDWNLGSRRLGGNRLTNYNWENNASNSGADCDDFCKDENDSWLIYQLPAAEQNRPGALPIAFHTANQQMGAYSVVQLQTAGYVAADMNAEVRPVPPAPDARWKKVEMINSGPIPTEPNLNDGSVYLNEQIAYYMAQFGSGDRGGINAYSIDNEPGLWHSSHPRLRGTNFLGGNDVAAAENANNPLILAAKAKGIEVIDKNIAAARAIRATDPEAEILGPEFWGFLGYYNLQNAADWPMFAGAYGQYVDLYLDRMEEASQTEGKRLLDVLTFHWYPQVPETPADILYAPQSLWDPDYRENSWIARDVLNGPVAVLPTLQVSVGTYFKGTDIGITEFRFGDANNGDTWYSGLAIADALGIYGKYGLYIANYHAVDLEQELGGFVESAYKLYRNYDGERSTFGDSGVTSTWVGPDLPIYSSVDSRGNLHVVIINKKESIESVDLIAKNPGQTYASRKVYGFSQADAELKLLASGPVVENMTRIDIPGHAAWHVVLERKETGGVEQNGGRTQLSGATIISKHDRSEFELQFSTKGSQSLQIELFDIEGKKLRTIENRTFAPGPHRLTIQSGDLLTGIYFCRISGGEEEVDVRFRVVR